MIAQEPDKTSVLCFILFIFVLCAASTDSGAATNTHSTAATHSHVPTLSQPLAKWRYNSYSYTMLHYISHPAFEKKKRVDSTHIHPSRVWYVWDALQWSESTGLNDMVHYLFQDIKVKVRDI